MAVRRLAEPALQPKSFAFTAGWAKRQITRYPEGRQASAILPILWRAQEQAGGWLLKADRHRRSARDAEDPRARGRDLLHDVQSRAGRDIPRPALRHHALRAAKCRQADQALSREDRRAASCQCRRQAVGRSGVSGGLRECAGGADKLRLL